MEKFPSYKSKIYISKKGWKLITPSGIDIDISNLAIKETIIQGYIVKKIQ